MPGTTVRQQTLMQAKRIVVKIGTNTLCHEGGGINRQAVSMLAGQIASVRKRGVAVTLVASGAIGTGLAALEMSRRPKTMPMLQAVAAVGQGKLMRVFQNAFARRGIRVGQVLLTREDFEDRTRYLNIRNTLASLAECDALPIINENDTVAVDEIRFGDNDVLAALVTNMLAADLLVFLTNVDGVLRGRQVLDVIEQVDDEAIALAGPQKSSLGSGGMASKLEAAGLVVRAGEAAVIANAATPNVLRRLLDGEPLGTVFVPARRKMSSRRRWIGQATRPAGRLVVDDGAARALERSGKSLLPSGITEVKGSFEKGAVVAVVDSAGREVARGLTNYSSQQVERIKGLKTRQIAQVLGDKPYDEVIHRNNMSLTGG